MDGAYSPPRNRSVGRRRVSSGGSDFYYEDVNPRFASEVNAPLQTDPVPSLLTPGPRHPPAAPRQVPGPNGEMIPLTSSYENLQEGARSPAESETSNFTSVSQRFAGAARGGRAGTRGGGAVRRPVGAPPAASSVGLGGESRYPVGP